MILGILGILRVLLSMAILFSPKESAVEKILTKASEYFGVPFFINFVLTFQMDISISAGLELTHSLESLEYQVFGKIIALAVVLCLTALLVVMIVKSIKYRTKPEKNQNWKELKDNLRVEVGTIGFFI